MGMVPSRIRKPSDWKSVKGGDVYHAVQKVQEESSIWSDVSGWSFSPKEIGNLGPHKKRRRMFTGTIYPSEFLDNVISSKKQKLITAGVATFVLFDILMIVLLINYVM